MRWVGLRASAMMSERSVASSPSTHASKWVRRALRAGAWATAWHGPGRGHAPPHRSIGFTYRKKCPKTPKTVFIEHTPPLSTPSSPPRGPHTHTDLRDEHRPLHPQQRLILPSGPHPRTPRGSQRAAPVLAPASPCCAASFPLQRQLARGLMD